MCGIVGYVGRKPAAEVLLDGLRRLEYRGYDSAGVAFFVDDQIEVWKSQGRLENVEKRLTETDETNSAHWTSTCGIGHTRWATHGKPSEANAHPHRTGPVVLVHNGIIENYLELKRGLVSRGHQPQSETDSELFGFLVLEEMDRGFDFVESVRRSFALLKGQCSIVVMSENHPGMIIGMRNGSPLVAAMAVDHGAIIASDAQPLVQYTDQVVYLENGDGVIATDQGLQFFDLSTGYAVSREPSTVEWTEAQMDLGKYAHYMLKEIHEQPSVMMDTLNGLIDRSAGEALFQLQQQPALDILASAEQLVLVACGTSWHAAVLGKYWIESWAKIPVEVELASEYRYREPVCRPGSVVIGISQSGETADTLAVLREMKRRNVPTLGICNVRGSTMAREAAGVFFTSAGPEIGVAATKTFMAQLVVMVVLAGFLASQRRTKTDEELNQSFNDLLKIPHLMRSELEDSSRLISQIKRIITHLSEIRGFFFIGRGCSYPMALEAALKLKEIAYDHAEGYAAGELKHGPIAMIDEGMAVVVLAPRDSWRDKTVSNLEEVKARGAQIIGIGDSEDEDLRTLCHYWIPLPPGSRSLDASLLAFLLAPAVQLLSYYRAVLKGTDVDKPRNLAKSVTVE